MKHSEVLFSRVPPELYEQFHEKALAEGTTASAVIRQLAVSYVAGSSDLKKRLRLVTELQKEIYAASSTIGV